MVTQMEATGKWFEQVCNNFRKATEAGLRLQQDLFKQAAMQWPNVAEAGTSNNEQMQTLKKEWREAMQQMLERHRTALNASYEAGIKALDEAFDVTEAQDFESYREECRKMFQKNFEMLKNMAEVNVQEYKATVEQWMDLAKKMSG